MILNKCLIITKWSWIIKHSVNKNIMSFTSYNNIVMLILVSVNMLINYIIYYVVLNMEYRKVNYQQ